MSQDQMNEIKAAFSQQANTEETETPVELKPKEDTASKPEEKIESKVEEKPPAMPKRRRGRPSKSATKTPEVKEVKEDMKLPEDKPVSKGKAPSAKHKAKSGNKLTSEEALTLAMQELVNVTSDALRSSVDPTEDNAKSRAERTALKRFIQKLADGMPVVSSLNEDDRDSAADLFAASMSDKLKAIQNRHFTS